MSVHTRTTRRPWRVLFTAAAGAVMVTLDTTVVVIANPAIGADLRTGLSGLQWVTTGYLLALTVSLIPAGALVDRWGARRAFLVGVAGFALASLSAAAAFGIGALIASRVAQGVFGALLQTSALGLVRGAFPVGRVAGAVGVFTATCYAATVAGPLLGGLAVAQAGWRWIFLINVPVGVAVLAAGAWLPSGSAVKRSAAPGAGGVLSLAAGIAALLWAVVEWPQRGWGGVAVVALPAGVLFAGFAVHQRTADAPLVPRAVLRSPGVVAGALLTGVAGFVLIGTAFVLAILLDGLGPAVTGLRVFPLTAGMVLGAVLGGPAVARVGSRTVCLLCATASAVALVAFAGAPGPLWPAVLGGGLGGLLVATTTTTITEVPPDLVGVASGLRQSALQLGGALGTAVLGATLAGPSDGGRRALLTAAAVVAAGVLPSLLMKGRTR